MPELEQFSEIEREFIDRAHRIVWCNIATVDSLGRPRSRIVHPIWEGLTGWIATRRSSFKDRHLVENPYLSLAYIADTVHPLYVDCASEWADDIGTKKRVWELYKAAPEPVGYDPAPFFVSFDHPNFGVLKLTPWRIGVVTQGDPDPMVWRSKRS
jgi:hypothetical protein